MHDIVARRFKTPGVDERGPFSWRKGRSQSVSWERFQTWVRQKSKEEQFWEPIFVTAALALWGWYVFWLYRAFEAYTIIPLP